MWDLYFANSLGIGVRSGGRRWRDRDGYRRGAKWTEKVQKCADKGYARSRVERDK